MLDLNALALELCGGDCSGTAAVQRMGAVVDGARRTRDLRFVDVAVWFAATLETAVGSSRPTAPSSQRIEEIRTNGRVALEVFVPSRVEGVEVEVPFILSPHWRY